MPTLLLTSRLTYRNIHPYPRCCWHSNGGGRVRTNQTLQLDVAYTQRMRMRKRTHAAAVCTDHKWSPLVLAYVLAYPPTHMRTSIAPHPSCLDHVQI